MECYVVDYIYHVMMCTGKYIHQFETSYVWHTILAGGCKILFFLNVEKAHLVWLLVCRLMF